MTSAVAAQPRHLRAAPAADRRPAVELCLLCGAPLHRASTRGFGARGVCGGCAERLEMDLTGSDSAACPDCGRHRELCAVLPCGRPQTAVQPIPLIKKPTRGQVSGAERVKTIERLAMSHLGVRELGRTQPDSLRRPSHAGSKSIDRRSSNTRSRLMRSTSAAPSSWRTRQKQH